MATKREAVSQEEAASVPSGEGAGVAPSDARLNEPARDPKAPDHLAKDDPEAPSNLDTPSRQVVRSFVPPVRDPAEFTEPGLEQGFYPGDPNLYQDPEKIERSY